MAYAAPAPTETLPEARTATATSPLPNPNPNPEPEADLAFLDLHPFVRSAVVDKIYGCIIGSALGDTVGLYTEFLLRSTCEQAYPERRFQLVEPVTEWVGDSHRSKLDFPFCIDDFFPLCCYPAAVFFGLCGG
jgi:hypothetical protein